MITPSTAMNAAPASSPMPRPPARTLTFSSDLASAISLETREEMSRLASATSRPIVGSSGDGPRTGVLLVPVTSLAMVRQYPYRPIGIAAASAPPLEEVVGLVPLLGESQHLVPCEQDRVAPHLDQPAASADHAHPEALADVQVREAAALRG